MIPVRSVLTALAFHVALLSAAPAAFLIGYDDATDPAYASGWANGSNGGFGFGPWGQFNLATFGIGDSNSNGSLGGPGINLAGQAWQAQQGVGWGGAMAGRSIGLFNPGDTLEVDVDFGAVPDPGQGVSVFGAMDACQVQAVGSPAGGFLAINTFSTTVPTLMPYSDGGYRVTFAHVAAGSMDVTLLSLASSVSLTYSVPYSPGVGIHNVSFQGNNAAAGQEFYANRLRLLSIVPEPSTLSLLGAALAGLALRRRR